MGEGPRNEENERVVERSTQPRDRWPGGQLGNQVEFGALKSDSSGQINVDGAEYDSGNKGRTGGHAF